MGRIVICECGQRNNLEIFRFGESRQCLACGRSLPLEQEVYKAEDFAPVVTGFEAEPGDDFGAANAFESPTALAVEAPPQPVNRSWEGSVRETIRNTDEGACCAKCRRVFRGDWDRNQRPEGIICHLCATQAEKDYVKPEDWLRRELYRPVPPRKVHQAPNPNEDELAKKKRKEILGLSVAAVVTLIAINVLPVEDWMALIFAADLDKAVDMPVAWAWVARGVNIAVSVLGQWLVLYTALAWSRLLYEGGLEENWTTLLYLAVAFTGMNELLSLASTYFIVLGPLAGILVGLAAVVFLYIKFLMIAERYPLRLESGFGFLLSWILCTFLMWPCTYVVHQAVQGIVSAIAL